MSYCQQAQVLGVGRCPIGVRRSNGICLRTWQVIHRCRKDAKANLRVWQDAHRCRVELQRSRKDTQRPYLGTRYRLDNLRTWKVDLRSRLECLRIWQVTQRIRVESQRYRLDHLRCWQVFQWSWEVFQRCRKVFQRITEFLGEPQDYSNGYGRSPRGCLRKKVRVERRALAWPGKPTAPRMIQWSAGSGVDKWLSILYVRTYSRIALFT